MAAELRRDGVTVHEWDATDIVGAPKDRIAPSDDDLPGSPLIVAINPDVAVHVLARLGRKRLAGRRVIGFWVWELDRLAPSWKVGAGWINEIWTPSSYSAAAMAAFGVPVVVTPHPIALADAAPLPSREQARRALDFPAHAFVASSSFSLASSLDRKNPMAAIAAFEQAFEAVPAQDALLVLRCLEADRYPTAWRALQLAVAQARSRRVRLLDPPGGIDTLRALYGASDCYISLHRAEGFGLNLAEAMAAGVPVIATGASGNLEFMTADCAMLVPATLRPARDAFGPYSVAGARWAEPDVGTASAMLRAAAGDIGRLRTLGAAGRAHVLAALQGGAAARALSMEVQ
ncbi:MAG: glycosyltransferase [Caulobacterales bacterium]